MKCVTIGTYVGAPAFPKAGLDFLSHLEMVPWGVLGQDDQGGYPAPDPSMTVPVEIVVDPAGLDHVTSGSTLGAGELSGRLYQWFSRARFPPAVVGACVREGDAKFHDYGTGQMVIHVITTGLKRFNAPGKIEGPIGVLSIAYAHVFMEFLRTDRQTLRLCALSSGFMLAASETG